MAAAKKILSKTLTGFRNRLAGLEGGAALGAGVRCRRLRGLMDHISYRIRALDASEEGGGAEGERGGEEGESAGGDRGGRAGAANQRSARATSRTEAGARPVSEEGGLAGGGLTGRGDTSSELTHLTVQELVSGAVVCGSRTPSPFTHFAPPAPPPRPRRAPP